MATGTKTFLMLVACCILRTAGAQTHWSFTFHAGTIYNVPMPLTISQNGYPDIKLNARFYSEPFTPPIYWDYRFTRWKQQAAWEFEAIHHKLYLENTPPEVTRFGISHGFNMVIINRVKRMGFLDYRLGAGFILAHPESIVRGKTFGETGDALDMGYWITGPVLNFSAGKPVYLAGPVFLNLEVRTTLAWSKVLIADGHATLYNWAFHAVCGIGFDFLKKDKKP